MKKILPLAILLAMFISVGAVSAHAEQPAETEIILKYAELGGQLDDEKGSINANEISFSLINNEYVDNSSGEFKPYNNWSRTGFIDVSKCTYVVTESTVGTQFCCWYSDATEASVIGTFVINQGETILFKPQTAKYMVISNTTTGMNKTRILNGATSTVNVFGATNVFDINLKYNDRSDLLAQLAAKGVLLVFTDLHGNATNLDRIAKFYNNNIPNYTLAIISLGDMTFDQATEDISWANTTFGKSVMKVIGNHDVLVKGSLPGITSFEAYNKYLANDIASWGVVQPANAETNGLTYYYKDVGSQNKYRIIVLDEYYYDEAQHNWFVSVLDDAISNNIPVMVAQHQANVTYSQASPLNADYAFATPQLGFDLYITIAGYSGDYSSAAENRVMAIDSFIGNGGKFICWLNGHTHSDQCHTLTRTNGKQLSLTFANAGITTGAYQKIEGYATDLFQYIAVDVTKGYVYVLRIGETCDKWMHKNLSLCYDYVNHQVINYN